MKNVKNKLWKKLLCYSVSTMVGTSFLVGTTFAVTKPGMAQLPPPPPPGGHPPPPPGGHPPPPPPGHPPPPDHPHPPHPPFPPPGGGGGGVTFDCSPAGKAKNVAKVDRVVDRRIAAMPRQSKLRKELIAARKEKDATVKARKYLAISGVKNPSSDLEVVRFFDKKADLTSNVNHLMQAYGEPFLSADGLVHDIQGALLGENAQGI